LFARICVMRRPDPIMKIAFIIWDYSPSRGGQERYLSRLAGALRAGGREVHVIAARFGGGESGGLVFHRVPLPRLGRTLGTLFFARRARGLVAREGFDITSGMARCYPLDVYRMGSGLHRVWLRRRGGAARLFSYLRPYTWLVLYLEKRIFDPANCRRIIANSRLCREQLISLYDYPAGKVEVVYNGVDHDFFHPRVRDLHRGEVLKRMGLPEERPAGLFVSNNLGRKGLDLVLRALALPEAGGHSLLVAGRGNASKFEKLARRLGVRERVRFAGAVADVRPLYGAADYLVLPTRYDPFANVCLEAMACGLPVVTTRWNGASEVIEEGASGFILPDPPDASSCAAAMGRAGSADSRARLSGAARAASLAFTVRRNAEETLAVYEKVMEEKRSRA
jgi:UDP-glucose:(heptosyl)LPS alpha-1,3-glucosyltransferase